MLTSLWRLWSHCWDSRNPPQFIQFSHIYIYLYIYTYCIYTYIYNYISYSIFLNLRIISDSYIFICILFGVYIYIYIVYIYIYMYMYQMAYLYEESILGTFPGRCWRSWVLLATWWAATSSTALRNPGAARCSIRCRRWLKRRKCWRRGPWGHAAAMVGPKEAKPLIDDLWWFMMVYQW